jgi:hypothetical protein
MFVSCCPSGAYDSWFRFPVLQNTFYIKGRSFPLDIKAGDVIGEDVSTAQAEDEVYSLALVRLHRFCSHCGAYPDPATACPVTRSHLSCVSGQSNCWSSHPSLIPQRTGGALERVTLNAFWLVFCANFQPEAHEEQNHLFSALSHDFVTLRMEFELLEMDDYVSVRLCLRSAKYRKSDPRTTMVQWVAYIVGHAVCKTLIGTFTGSRHMFTAVFRDDVFRFVGYLFNGTPQTDHRKSAYPDNRATRQGPTCRKTCTHRCEQPCFRTKTIS